MARNRKRAKERRARRPQGASVGAVGRVERDEAPDPIQHATPDVELAEAQLALGRSESELAQEADAAADEAEFELEAEQSAEAEQELEFGDAPAIPGVTPGPVRLETDENDIAPQVPARRAAAPAERRTSGNRLFNFLQGSWHELQRVQWPDRRQVMQATGVVIGFVIVAGVFLGVADFLSGKLVTYILK